MEEKSDRRHTTGSEADYKHRPCKDDVKGTNGGGYSMEQKFADFLKITPDSPESKCPDDSRRRVTEGCDAKIGSYSSAGGRDSKQAMGADDDDDVADREFAEMMKRPATGSVALASDPRAKAIALGLSIEGMNMTDNSNGRLLWHCGSLGSDIFQREMEARVPKEILQCAAVSRELIFSSVNPISKFRLEQRVYLGGVCIEEHLFSFGFVIPGSTNSWQQIIYAASPEKMMTAEQLSGKVTFETAFYDDATFLCKVLFRVFYD